ncbi:MAG: 16S rRNA (guanine(966)-N(2))-methyltransferase RsmD [Acidobacteriota bacterium]
MLRVIGGLYKGRKLKTIKDPDLKPTKDIVKETLFNILGNEAIRNSCFLDGYAGTGNIGIEAFSRGAREVFFIEISRKFARIIKENLDLCGIYKNYKLIINEFNRGVIEISKMRKSFDLIFLDPPYEILSERDPLKVIKKRDILKKDGLIILEHSKKIQFETKYFKLKNLRKIGDTALSFFVHY